MKMNMLWQRARRGGWSTLYGLKDERRKKKEKEKEKEQERKKETPSPESRDGIQKQSHILSISSRIVSRLFAKHVVSLSSWPLYACRQPGRAPVSAERATKTGGRGWAHRVEAVVIASPHHQRDAYRGVPSPDEGDRC